MKVSHFLDSLTTFRGKMPGQFVTFWIPAGINIRGKQEYKRKRGRIVMAFESHLTVNGGGKHGTPYVVDESNFIH